MFSLLLLAAFVDVSPEETKDTSPFESTLKDVAETSSFRDGQVAEEVTNYYCLY